MNSRGFGERQKCHHIFVKVLSQKSLQKGKFLNNLKYFLRIKWIWKNGSCLSSLGQSLKNCVCLARRIMLYLSSNDFFGKFEFCSYENYFCLFVLQF